MNDCYFLLLSIFKLNMCLKVLKNTAKTIKNKTYNFGVWNPPKTPHFP